jgi:hypothetical protein
MTDQEEFFKAPDWVANQPIQESQEGPTKGQRQLLTVVLVVVIPLFLFLGWFEFGRAQQGNWRAWVYTFEWPFFAILAFYLWRKLMNLRFLRLKIWGLEKKLIPKIEMKIEFKLI